MLAKVTSCAVVGLDAARAPADEDDTRAADLLGARNDPERNGPASSRGPSRATAARLPVAGGDPTCPTGGDIEVRVVASSGQAVEGAGVSF